MSLEADSLAIYADDYHSWWGGGIIYFVIFLL